MNPQQWNNNNFNFITANSAPSYYPSNYSSSQMITSHPYYCNPDITTTNNTNYPQDDQSHSCSSIDFPSLPPIEQQLPTHHHQQNYYYPTSTESSPSPTVTSTGLKFTCKYPPVRKLTRASSNPSNCSTPQPNTASNGYCYLPHPDQQFLPIALPSYDPIIQLKSQDPTKPLYDGQKRGRKPKSDADAYDEEKKLAKRNYGRHYRQNKTLDALKVQEKFKTTKCYMDTIKNWANLVGCMELAKLVDQHEKLMDDIEKFTGENS